MIAAAIGALSCLIWLVLLVARGGFWRILTLPAGPKLGPGAPPRVAVVVPARNEADVIGDLRQGRQ